MAGQYPTARVIGGRIHALREAQAVSVRALAKRAQMPHTNLLKIERGDINVPIETLQRLATALGVPLVALMPGADGAPGAPSAALLRCEVLLGEASALLRQVSEVVTGTQAVLPQPTLPTDPAHSGLVSAWWSIPCWTPPLFSRPCPALAFAS